MNKYIHVAGFVLGLLLPYFMHTSSEWSAIMLRSAGSSEHFLLADVITTKISSRLKIFPTADAHAYLTLGVCFNNKSCQLYNKGMEHGFSSIKVIQDPCQKITKLL